MSHTIQIEGTDVAFPCEPTQSVLDAALRAGIELPYSCRKGVCGNCAGSIASGETAAVEGVPMHNETCQPGQVLLCGCAPASALVIRPTSWKQVDPSAIKRFTAKVYSHDLAAPDVSVLRLRLPTGQRARFHAGQYLRVLMDDGSARSYSMANPPQESDGVTLHVRHVAGGAFTSRLATLKQGDTLQIELPFGNVTLPPEDTRPIVLVAGGTGFAPVRSIVEDMARRRVQRDITFVWGARDATGLYQSAAVDKWRKQWPALRYVPALSDAPAADVPGAFQGRADEALAASFTGLTGHVVHCCGSPAMVNAVREVALRLGVAPSDFHADVFVPGPAPN